MQTGVHARAGARASHEQAAGFPGGAAASGLRTPVPRQTLPAMPNLREHLFARRPSADPMFRWRGGDVSRLEGLSDGVFALTLTLLIVSLEVPRSFHDLWQSARDLPVFFACFVLLMWAWRHHYLFFRRYGLEDLTTTVLNGAFLFLVLFYAYPTRFVATFLWRLCLGEPTGDMFAAPAGVPWLAFHEQSSYMMLFYAAGLVGVFGSLALLFGWALHRRRELELDELECFLTRSAIVTHSITVANALLSIGVIVVGGPPVVAGLVYFLMGPAHGVWGWWSGSRAARIRAALGA